MTWARKSSAASLAAGVGQTSTISPETTEAADLMERVDGFDLCGLLAFEFATDIINAVVDRCHEQFGFVQTPVENRGLGSAHGCADQRNLARRRPGRRMFFSIIQPMLRLR